MKGGGQRQGRVRDQHGAPCRPSPGERGGGGTTRQGCRVGGPRLLRVEPERFLHPPTNLLLVLPTGWTQLTAGASGVVHGALGLPGAEWGEEE